MAANDYHVIVYRLLTYLYECLKSGKNPDMESILMYKRTYGINEKYWAYVLVNMQEAGLVTGISIVPVMGAHWKGANITDGIMITPLGIEYLESNSLMNKIKNISIKEAVDIASAVATNALL